PKTVLLSLHDALPISESPRFLRTRVPERVQENPVRHDGGESRVANAARGNWRAEARCAVPVAGGVIVVKFAIRSGPPNAVRDSQDRKSTRLNSSHSQI